MKPAGPVVGSGSSVITEPGQRGMAFSAYARSVARSARCAKAEKGRRARRTPSERRFMSLRINRPIPVFNPAFDPPLDVHDVAEAGDGEEFRRQRAVRGG